MPAFESRIDDASASPRSASVPRTVSGSYGVLGPCPFSGRAGTYALVARVKLDAGYALTGTRVLWRSRNVGNPARIPMGIAVGSDLRPLMQVYPDSAMASAISPDAMTPGQWHTIVAWRDGATIRCSLDGGTAGSAAIDDVAILADAVTINYSPGSTGAYSPNGSTGINGTYLDFQMFAPFNSADIPAIVAAPLAGLDEQPTGLASTRIGHLPCDGPHVRDRVDPARRLRWWNIPPAWEPAPATRADTRTDAFPGGHVSSYMAGDRRFTFDPVAPPTYRVGPNRLEFDEQSSGRHDGPILSGRDRFFLSLAGNFPVPLTGSYSIWSEPADDGSLIDLRMHAYGILEYRMLGPGGAPLSSVTGGDSLYGMRTVSGATSETLTGLNSSSDAESRVVIPNAGGQRFATGHSVRFAGEPPSWSDIHCVVEAPDDQIVMIQSAAGVPPPPNGTVVYGTGRVARRARQFTEAQAPTRSVPRHVNLTVERKLDGTVEIRTKGHLLVSGNVGAANVGAASGVTSHLGARPGSADPGCPMIFAAVALLDDPAEAEMKRIDLDHTIILSGRSDYLDAPVQSDGREAARHDTRIMGQHPYELAIRDAAGTLVEQDYAHPTTGQAISRFHIQQHLPIGSVDLAAEAEYTPTVTIWPPERLVDGTVNPDRAAAPVHERLAKIVRGPLDDSWLKVYVDPLNVAASDEADNPGTDPARPLLTLKEGIRRGLLSRHQLLVAPGDYKAEGAITVSGVIGPARIDCNVPGGVIEVGLFKQNSCDAVHIRDVTSRDQWRVGDAGNVGTSRGCSAARCKSGHISGSTTGSAALGTSSLAVNWAEFCTFDRFEFDSSQVIDTPYTIFAEGGSNVSITRYAMRGLNGGGSHSCRWQFAFRVALAHLLDAGPALAAGDGITFRRMITDVVFADWVTDHRELKFVGQTGLGENPLGNTPRVGHVVERVHVRNIQLRDVIAAFVAQVVTDHQWSADFDAITPSNHSAANAWSRVFGCKHNGNASHQANNWSRAATAPTSGPYRNETLDGTDFGPVTCPDYLSVHAVAPGVVALKAEGYAHGGVGHPKLTHQYRAIGTPTWTPVPALGAPEGTHVLPSGSYEFRMVADDGATVGSVAAVTVEATTPEDPDGGSGPLTRSPPPSVTLLGPGRVRVTWEPPTGGSGSYLQRLQVRRAGSAEWVDVLDATASPARLGTPPLLPGGSYVVRVRQDDGTP